MPLSTELLLLAAWTRDGADPVDLDDLAPALWAAAPAHAGEPLDATSASTPTISERAPSSASRSAGATVPSKRARASVASAGRHPAASPDVRSSRKLTARRSGRTTHAYAWCGCSGGLAITRPESLSGS